MTIFDFDIDVHTDRKVARRLSPRVEPGGAEHVAAAETPLAS